jgi:hypothetical protein
VALGLTPQLQGQLVTTAIVGAVAWLMGKAWDLQAVRRARYAETLALLTAVQPDEAAVAAALTRLWVEAPTPVVLAGEAVRRAAAGERQAAVLRLAIAMRRDTTLWAWASPRRWRKLQAPDLASGDRP